MDTAILSWVGRLELAQRYAPHLVLFPEQRDRARPSMRAIDIGDYHPRGVGPLIERGKLFTGLFDPRLDATIKVVGDCKNKNAQLRIVGRSFPNADAAWKSYFDILDNPAGNRPSGRERFPLTIYARVHSRAEVNVESKDTMVLGAEYPPDVKTEVGRPFFSPIAATENDLAIQYWFCYYYDDWANQHEGDWEGICIFLRRKDADYIPVGASYYAHETGLRRRWEDVEHATPGNTHPLVYVAAGSHASYYQYVPSGYVTTVQNYILPIVNLKLKIGLATARLDVVPDSRLYEPVQPRVELLPDPVGPDDKGDPVWEHTQWLAYSGTWGVNVLGKLGFGGPTGPRQKGLKWRNPLAWMERHCVPDYLVY